MKLWKIWQEQNQTYDTYDSAVVAAETEEVAKKIIPGHGKEWSQDGKLMRRIRDKVQLDQWPSWASELSAVQVQYLGEASPDIETGIIVASFNPG